MYTEYLGPIDPNDLESATHHLEKAVLLLQQGEVVAFPTETVYGLGASIFNEKAISDLYRIKHRSFDHSLPIQLAHLNQLQFVAREIPPQVAILARAFLPGPLTLILKRHPRISPLICGNKDSVAIRFPSNPIAKRILEMMGCPLAVPSANLTGKPSAICIKHVLEDFNGQLRAVVDGGFAEYGVESTILSLENPSEPKICRFGAIPKKAIEMILNSHLSSPPKVSHFPKLKSTIRFFSSLSEIEIYLRLSQRGKRIVMGMEPPPPSMEKGAYFQLSSETLYEGLRRSDREGMSEILIPCDQMKQDQDLLLRLKAIAF